MNYLITKKIVKRKSFLKKDHQMETSLNLAEKLLFKIWSYLIVIYSFRVEFSLIV